MEYFWVKEVEFIFYVLNKKNWKHREYKRTFKYDECKQELEDLTQAYKESHERDYFEEKKCRYCWFKWSATCAVKEKGDCKHFKS